MMRNAPISMRLTVVLALLISFSAAAQAQGFKPPEKGKSVVYFARINKFHAVTQFLLFHGDQFVADFPGQSYVRYECDPGEQLFWVSAESRDFILTELLPDKSYLVLVDAKEGQQMPQVELVQMITRHKDFHIAKWAITHKAPVEESPQTVEEETRRMAPFIARCLAEYDQLPEDEKEAKFMSADMSLPVEKF